jgi:hypothetical protein
MRSKLVTSAIIIVAIVVILRFRFSDSSDAPSLTGHWRSWRSNMEISRHADVFTVSVDNPKGLLGGKYSGHFRNDAIHVVGPLAPLCGDIKYVPVSHRLEFCGEEFERVQDSQL